MKKLKYLIMPLLICSIIVSGCGKKETNSNTNTNTNTNTNNQTSENTVPMNVEVKDKYLYVNNNKVDTYSIVKSEFSNSESLTEADFYNNEVAEYNYNVINDIVLVHVNGQTKWSSMFIVDSQGNLVKTHDELLPVPKYQYAFSEVNGKTIEFKVYYKQLNQIEYEGDQDYCEKLATKHLEDEYYHIDTLTYVGNKQFEYKSNVRSVSFKDNNLTHDPCLISAAAEVIDANVISKYPGAIFIENSYEYIAYSNKDSGELLILNYNGDIIKKFDGTYVQRIWAHFKVNENGVNIIELSGKNYSTGELVSITYDIDHDLVLDN